MRSFRDMVRHSRRDLHSRMSREAIYVYGDGANRVEIACTVRVHDNLNQLGDLKGTSFQYAERYEVVPLIRFRRSDVPTPERGAFVMLSADEGYALENVLPPDDEFISAEATRLTRPNDFAGLPYPGQVEGEGP